MTVLEFVQWCQQNNVDDKSTINLSFEWPGGAYRPLETFDLSVNDEGNVMVRRS